MARRDTSIYTVSVDEDLHVTLTPVRAISFFYVYRNGEILYSSCIVLSGGKIVHNYRRVSRGWKEYTRTDFHYCEGEDTEPFELYGKKIMPALCGDLWDAPERFKTDHLLIWPVYVNYTPEEWENGALDEYAEQAFLASGDTLMIWRFCGLLPPRR